ncbi:MAG: hypothetical protein QOJ07_2222, partial [Thermoleophilaceae bacterium]|nr:hypothetical protein [Thermoleophilaceae bacterium]
GELLEGDGDLKAKARSAVQAGRFYSRWLPQLAVGQGHKPGSYGEFGSLAKHLRYTERASRKLARSTFYAMTRYQAGLEKKQAVLGRIVDIGAELFAIASAVVYANTLKNDNPSHGEQAFELADVFAKQARRRADQLFSEVFANDDDANYKTAQNVLSGRYTWLEEGIVDPGEDHGDQPLVAGQPEGLEEKPAEAQAEASNGSGNGSNGHGETVESPAVTAKVQ